MAALGPAFDPEPPPSELAVCHTPYAQLGADDVEGTLTELLERFGRVGVVGPVGCGKTSLARYVAETSPALAPIYLNVAAEDHDKVSSPRGFLELLVSHLADAATEATGGGARQQDRLLRGGQPTVDLAGEERGRTLKVGASWLASGSVASDLVKTLPPREAYRTIAQMAGPANEALDAIRAHDLVPVLVASSPCSSPTTRTGCCGCRGRTVARCSTPSSARCCARSSTSSTTSRSSWRSTTTTANATATRSSSRGASSITSRCRS